jgi:hypothetical protein
VPELSSILLRIRTFDVGQSSQIRILLLGQNLVHKLNNHGSFAHGIGDTLHALSSDIANRENPGKARFEHIRSPVQGPALLNLDTGLDETFCVGRETPSKPFSVGVRRGSASATDGP